MLRSTHKVIAERIASELGFTEDNAKIFISGSTGPDSHGDFPHASGHDRKIMSKIDVARTLFLQNDEYSYGELANALHYIRDKWTHNPEVESEQVFIMDDETFLQSIEQLKMPEEAAEQYLQVAKSLLTIKNAGLESWFNLLWGIWHRDYASCVYVFTDIVEMMLPTLNPDISIASKKQNLKAYVKSEAFTKATKTGFFASLVTNYLYPKLTGYPAAIHTLASINPQPDYSNAAIDLNIAYRLSLEIARYTLLPPEQSKCPDAWTNKLKDKDSKYTPLKYIMSQYHVLIPKPVDEVSHERLLRFDNDGRNFLEEWPKLREVLPEMRHRSETWKIILSGLVELLKAKQGWD